MTEPVSLARVAGVPDAIPTFEEFFRSHYRDLARALLLLTGDPSEAEDLAQEAFARVLERWERVRVMASPTGYAYRTALNLNRKRLRWVAVRARRILAGRHEPDPAEAAGTRVDVLQAMRAIPAAQREALVLVEWLGLGAEEAGEVLGIAPESVRGRCHRGRASLRTELGVSDE